MTIEQIFIGTVKGKESVYEEGYGFCGHEWVECKKVYASTEELAIKKCKEFISSKKEDQQKYYRYSTYATEFITK